MEAVESDPSTAGHVAHRDKDKLVRGSSLIGLIPGILKNETIACRQRGHGIDPGGPGTTVDVLLVEHR